MPYVSPSDWNRHTDYDVLNDEQKLAHNVLGQLQPYLFQFKEMWEGLAASLNRAPDYISPEFARAITVDHLVDLMDRARRTVVADLAGLLGISIVRFPREGRDDEPGNPQLGGLPVRIRNALGLIGCFITICNGYIGKLRAMITSNAGQNHGNIHTASFCEEMDDETHPIRDEYNQYFHECAEP